MAACSLGDVLVILEDDVYKNSKLQKIWWWWWWSSSSSSSSSTSHNISHECLRSLPIVRNVNGVEIKISQDDDLEDDRGELECTTCRQGSFLQQWRWTSRACCIWSARAVVLGRLWQGDGCRQGLEEFPDQAWPVPKLISIREGDDVHLSKTGHGWGLGRVEW